MTNDALEKPARREPSGRGSILDGELDLRPLIDTLVRWWKEIVAITAVVVIAAVGLFEVDKAQQVPVYAASASVAMVRTVSDVSFDPRFRTVSQDTANPGDLASSARRNSLIGLVRNGGIADKVLAEIGDQLPEDQRYAGALLGRIYAEALIVGDERTGMSDLIRVTAFGATPEDATLLANAWAQAYVETVNQIYGQVPDELLNSVKAELVKAEQQHAEAQQNLQEYIVSSRTDDINRAIFEKQEVLDNLRRGRTTAINALVDEAVKSRQQVISAYLSAQTRNSLVGFDKEQDAERALLVAYIDTLTSSQMEVFQQQADSASEQLAYYYAEKMRNNHLLDDVRALRVQIEEGGQSSLATSTVALQLLKLQAFTRFGNSNVYLQVTPSVQDTQVVTGSVSEIAPEGASVPVPISSLPVGIPVGITANQTFEEALADLDALIVALEGRVTDAETQIQALSTQLLSGDGYQYLNVHAPDDSELSNAIAQLYPQLFEPGTLTEMSESVTGATGLATAARLKASDLLDMKELTELVDFSTQDQPLTQAVAKLSDDIQVLRGELAAENSKENELTQLRDLAWQTKQTLRSKVAELTLARAATSTEVRLAAPAIPPGGPVPGESVNTTAIMSFAGGLALALVVVFLAEFLGKRPFFSFRSRRADSSLSPSS